MYEYQIIKLALRADIIQHYFFEATASRNHSSFEKMARPVILRCGGTMTARGTLGAIVACFTVTIAYGVNVPCPAGTRVYSLSVWSGSWLDGLIMRCTGDSDEETIPQAFNDDPGGEEDADICAGTGGVQSLYWEYTGYYVIVNLNITCLDNQTYQFADGRGYNYWNTTGNQTVSCDEGEYVQGISYSVYEPETITTYSYYLTDLVLMCSSSTLDPICTDCSGDTTLLSEQDQPEYCELPSCSEAECCETNDDEEVESFASDIVIGVVSTVVAAIIVSASAWAFHKFKNTRFDGKGATGFQVEEAPSGTTHPVDSPES